MRTVRFQQYHLWLVALARLSVLIVGGKFGIKPFRKEVYLFSAEPRREGYG